MSAAVWGFAAKRQAFRSRKEDTDVEVRVPQRLVLRVDTNSDLGWLASGSGIVRQWVKGADVLGIPFDPIEFNRLLG